MQEITDVKQWVSWLRKEIKVLEGEPIGVLYAYLPNTMLEEEIKALKAACKKLGLKHVVDKAGKGSVVKQ